MQESQTKITSGEKILIVTKKSSFSDSLIDSLNKLGYSAFQENTSVKGIEKIYDLLPRLIIVDIDLDDTDGYVVLEKKCSEPVLSKIPVFLMSTNGVPVNMRKVPPNCVTEFMMSLHTEVEPIVQKINSYFGRNEKSALPQSNSKKILWVEDDKLIGTILSKKLIASGFTLTHAKTGDEAVSILASDTKFDAALLDLILPGMSGFDILQKIKTNPATKHIPVMILSNLSKPSDIERAKILGAQKFLVKAATSLDKIVEETKELASL